jgi:hypothetical protein
MRVLFVVFWNALKFNEGTWICTPEMPALNIRFAYSGLILEPLVVMPISFIPHECKVSTISIKSFLNVGSPPVN